MNIQVVAIEKEDFAEKAVYGSSGIALDGKYVITTANIFLSELEDCFLNNGESIVPGKLHSLSHINNPPEAKIIFEESKKYKVKNGQLLAFFMCKDLQLTIRRALQGWAVDVKDNSKDLETVLSLFVVINILPTGNIDDFKKLLLKWWDLVQDVRIFQTDEIFVKSVPFGNRFFLSSYSKGIVSNIVGQNSCLIISDCPSTPGSEGSPVFRLKSNSDIPVGILISSSCWWRREWTGLTLIVDIRTLLLELLERYYYKATLENIPHHLIACVDLSLVHVYSGSTRGTAIIIDVQNGFLLTNSHVISNENSIEIYWRGHKDSASVIYRTPDNEVYDVAVLQCSPTFLNNNNLRSITIANEKVNVGDDIICAGFAIFTRNVDNPTVSKGHVTQCNQSMILTTSCINSGMSGGPLLNTKGELIGIIVCNTRIQDIVYPHLNMAIPYAVLEKSIHKFLKYKDKIFLHLLSADDPKLISAWKQLEAKL